MLYDKCSHCRRRFMSRGRGMAELFCRSCIDLCEKSLTKLQVAFHYSPQVPLAQLAQDLKIPPDFMYYLSRFGRLQAMQLRQQTVKHSSAEPCMLCRRALEVSEKIYCADCDVIVKKRLHTRYGGSAPQGMGTMFR